jgi:DNA-binding transcriptional MerR regulator
MLELAAEALGMAKAEEEAQAQAPSEYTIDELASVAQVPSRTIRFYQSRGALQAPEIRGRVAYYGKPHIERLKLIAQLQDRGLRIDAIRDLLSSIDRGEIDLAEWLGVEQEVQASWTNDQPRTVNEAELYDLAGRRRPGLLADLVRTKLVERHGEVYLVPSPGLLGVAMKLEAVGIDLETAAGASVVMRKYLARAASELVEYVVKRAKEVTVDDLGKLFQELRPTGMEAVRVIFGREMERELRKLVESGKLATSAARARRGKKKG